MLFAAGTGTILSEFVPGLGAYVPEVIPLSMPFGREDDGYQPGLDGVLLGLVDILVTVRRHVHRARQPWADRA